jgi:hypothetical protein
MLQWLCTRILWAGCPGGSEMENNIFKKLDVLNASSNRIYSLEYIGKVYILRLDAREILHALDYSEILDFVQELLDGYFAHPRGWLGEVEEDILTIV